MYVRLAFSVAAHLEPEILLVDEVLAVGDAEFQARCLGRMEDVRRERQHGALRLAQHAGDGAALRPGDSARRMGGSSRDGPSEEVVAHYLQTSVGAGSSREWPDLEEAPGDDLVRLRSVRVVQADGSPADYVDVREPVGIEIAFRVLRDGPPILPKIKVVSRRAHRLQRHGHRRRGGTSRREPGEYVATAWIPGNFLNEGLITVDPAICSIDSPKLHHHVSVWQAVSFHVQDPGEGDSARGQFTGQWRGVVRPVLEWTNERRSSELR